MKKTVVGFLGAAFLVPAATFAYIDCRETVTGCTAAQLAEISNQTHLTLQDRIAALQQLVQMLVAQIAQIKAGTTTPTSVCFVPTYNLYIGRTDAETNGEVSKLQAWLYATGYFPDAQGTGYYGEKTAAAVVKWQKAHGMDFVTLKSGVGPMTRSKIKEMCGTGRSTLETLPATYSLADIETMRAQGASQKCENLNAPPAEVMYIADKKILYEMTLHTIPIEYTLIRDRSMTSWSNTSSEGVQTPYDSGYFGWDERKKYRCEAWDADLSRLSIPPGIVVTDLAASTPDSVEDARGKNRDSRRIADLKRLQLALELYYDAHRTYPTGLKEQGSTMQDALTVLVSMQFISSIPNDPLHATAYTYAALNGGRGYIIAARLENWTNPALTSDIDGAIDTDTGVVVCDDETGIYCVGELDSSVSSVTSKRNESL